MRHPPCRRCPHPKGASPEEVPQRKRCPDGRDPTCWSSYDQEGNLVSTTCAEGVDVTGNSPEWGGAGLCSSCHSGDFDSSNQIGYVWDKPPKAPSIDPDDPFEVLKDKAVLDRVKCAVALSRKIHDDGQEDAWGNKPSVEHGFTVSGDQFSPIYYGQESGVVRMKRFGIDWNFHYHPTSEDIVWDQMWARAPGLIGTPDGVYFNPGQGLAGSHTTRKRTWSELGLDPDTWDPGTACQGLGKAQPDLS